MRIIFAIAASVALYGCAASPQLPLQYATLKLIERDAVTADAVIDRTERLQALIDADAELTLVDLQSRAREIVGYDSLPPSDRLLIDALMGDVSYDLGVDVESSLSDEQRRNIAQRLEWIAQAAAMAD